MLQVSELTYAYNYGQTLSWPSFEVLAAKPLVILGPSGSGKTTLLHLIAGLLKPKSGQIHLNGTPLNSLSSKELDQVRGKEMGILFQHTHYWASLSLKENLALISKVSGFEVSETKILERLDALGIMHLSHKKPQECSVGEQQRLGLAMATIHDPSLVLADEPTSALDHKNCTKALTLLQKNVVEQGKCLLIITHDSRVTSFYDQVIELEEKL